MSNPKKKMIMNEAITYNVYEDLFYVENTDYDNKKAIGINRINRLYMTFLSSCFTLADEAYTTIGPLEFVKFQKPIMAGKIDISCISLIESLGSNFSMILSHIQEYLEHAFEPAVNFQGISDAVAKYILRANAIFQVGCLNVYGQEILAVTSIEMSYDEKLGFDSHSMPYVKIIGNYISKLESVDGADPNKKDRYFDIFKEVFEQKKVLNIFQIMTSTYTILFNKMIQMININIFKDLPPELTVEKQFENRKLLNKNLLLI